MRPAVWRSMLLSLLMCSTTAAASVDAPTLYERLGGAKVIAAISEDLIEAAANDPRTARSWRKVNLRRVKDGLSEQLCALTGGPCTYTGDTMEDIHAGLDITEAEMYVVVQMLRDVMVAHEVQLRERNEVLALLAPMKRDIVTK